MSVCFYNHIVSFNNRVRKSAFDNPVLQKRGVVLKCADSDVKDTAFDTVLPVSLSSSGHSSQQSDVYGATYALQGVCHQEIAQDTFVPDKFILDLDYDADSVDCDLMPAPLAPTARVPDETCNVPSDKKEDDDCQSVSSEDSGFHFVSSTPEREEFGEDIWFVVDSCGDTSELYWSSQSYRKQASRRHKYESSSTSRPSRRHGSYRGNYCNSRRRDDRSKDFKRKRSYDNHYYSDRSSKRRRYY